MITLCFIFLYNTGDMVTVSMVTPDIVYIPMLKGTILSLLIQQILICIMRLNWKEGVKELNNSNVLKLLTSHI